MVVLSRRKRNEAGNVATGGSRPLWDVAKNRRAEPVVRQFLLASNNRSKRWFSYREGVRPSRIFGWPIVSLLLIYLLPVFRRVVVFCFVELLVSGGGSGLSGAFGSPGMNR